MNEELKIIITAVTQTAKKNIDEVKNKLKETEKEGEKSGSGLTKAFKAIGVAAGVVVGAIGAVIGALTALGKNSREFRELQGKLTTAFAASGSSAEQATETYKNLFRFLGKSDVATEAATHLAKLTTNEKELAEWTTALQGIYTTFGASLPIEGLTEAANETAKVGAVTGTLADALNWVGISEDAFNAQLAATNSEAEREALIRNTLNETYKEAAALYEKNNADIIAANEAQARLDFTTAKLGKTVQPLLTALANLSNTLLTALSPAIAVVSNALTWLVNKLSIAVQWIAKFFSMLSGKEVTIGGVSEAIAGVGGAASGLGNAANSAGNLAGGLGDATKQAEKLKKVTSGFDELNVLSSASSGGSGEAATGGSGGASSGAIGGFSIDTGAMDSALDKSGGKIGKFVDTVKKKFTELKKVFAPTIQAFKDFGVQVSESIKKASPDFEAGLKGFSSGLEAIASYLLEEFIPNIVNGFSTSFLPILGDLTQLTIEETGKSFESLGGIFDSVSKDIIIPALESLETITTDIFDGIKKAWDKSGGELLTSLGKFFSGIREDIEDFYNNLLLPVWKNIQRVLDEVWANGLKPLWDEIAEFVLEVGVLILSIYHRYIKPLIEFLELTVYPVIVWIVDYILSTISTLATGIANFARGTIQSIKGITQFLTGIFTNDWRKAWEGIKNIFGGIWNSLVQVVKVPLNLIIDAINGLISGIVTGVNIAIRAINRLSFTVPDWVPEYGGEKFGFNIKELSAPKIPKLATGGIVDSATLAVIGERGKEAVLPLENNTAWMDALADRLAAKMNPQTKVVLMLNEKELGWANINSINSITQQTGQLQLMV